MNLNMQTNTILQTVKHEVCHYLNISVPHDVEELSYKSMPLFNGVATARIKHGSYWELYERNSIVDK